MSNHSTCYMTHTQGNPTRVVDPQQRISSSSVSSQTPELFLDTSLDITPNETWGDILTTKQPNSLRIYFQNVNGLQPTPTWDKWKEVLSELFRNEVDVAGLVETNINWTPIRSRQANILLRKQFGNGTMINATSDEPSSSVYKQGGTSLLLTGNIIGAIDHGGTDQRGLGRWSYCIIHGRNNIKVVIITAYRICQDTLTTGIHTAYSQQYRILRRQNVLNPNPKKIFDHDLAAQIKQWRHNKYDILLMIDANTHLLDTRLQRIITDGGLYDLIGCTHGVHSPPTYQRGSHTIDFLFGTNRFKESIKRCGHLAYNQGIISDHRALWIDFDITLLFRQQFHDIYKRPPVMTAKNKKWSARARQITSAHILKYNVRTAIDELQRQVQDPTKRKQSIEKLEMIDSHVHVAMLSGAKAYKVHHNTWWSPDIHHAYLTEKFWKLKKVQAVTKISMMEPMCWILSQLPETSPLREKINDSNILSSLRKAKNHLHSLRQKDGSLRQDFIDHKIKQYYVNNENATARALQRIRNSEIQSYMYKKIRAYLHPAAQNQINYLDVPIGDKIQRLTKKQEMEQALLDFHKRHFSQAKNTPFANPDFTTRFGRAADTVYAKQFRAGDDSETKYWDSEAAQEFLNQFRPHADDPPKINTSIQLDQLKKGFRIWREATGTSPSGRKLPLYKIWLTNETVPDALDGDAFLTIILDIITLSQTLQYPLRRWKIVNNIFIPKDPGVRLITRLRPLHEIEAELNYIRRELVARRLIKNAEEYNMIPKNNCGGRKGRSAMDVVMLKYITLSTCTMQRRNCALTDCDARACYDRILPILLSLCYCKMGLPAEDSIWLTRALANMEYHMVTNHGISIQTSKTDNSGPIYGIGQGATDAPAGWLLLSTILSKIYDRYASGCKLSNPTKDTHVHWTHTMFVDDTYLIHATSQKSASVTELKTIVQKDLNKWNEGLHFSGGYLNEKKTNYIILNWLFTPSGLPYLDDTIIPTNPVLLNTSDTPETIQQLCPYHNTQEFKSLGVRTPATLSDHYEFQNMLKKGRTFSKFLSTCPLTRKEAWIAYNVYFVPSYTYSAVALSLTTKDIHKIHCTFMPLLLNKLGFQASFPRAVAFVPRHVGGIGITPLNVIIVQRKLRFLYSHLRHNSDLGKAIMINLQWAMVQAGRQNPLFTTDDRIDYIENSWAIHLHNELSRMTGKLVIDGLHSGSLQRINDKYLMDEWDKEGLDIKLLRHLNLCRLYLCVSKLSDITTNNGLFIQEGYLSGERKNPYTTHDWPRQPSPSHRIWKLWRYHLKKTFYKGDKLHCPLGSWLTYLPTAHTRFIPTEQKLIHIANDGIYSAPTIVTRKTVKHNNTWTREISTAPSIPLIEDTNPQTIPSTNGYVTLQHTWEQFRQQQWRKYQSVLSKFSPVSKYIPLDLLSTDTIYVVSDGGVADTEGYYGWVIATSSNIVIEGHGYVPGNPSHIDSLRAESMGMLHALTVMSHQQEQTNCSGQIVLASDNLELVHRTKTYIEYGSRFANQYTAPHMDIQCAIDQILAKLCPQIEATHVLGHQDTKKDAQLTWLEFLNVRADHIATYTRYNRKSLTNEQQLLWLPQGKIQLYLNNIPHNKWVNKAIHQAATTNDFINFLRTKLNWKSSTYNEVDWSQRDYIMRRSSPVLQRWILKLSTNRLPLLGEKFMTSTTTLCPVCNRERETTQHFLTCSKYPTLTDKELTLILGVFAKQRVDPYLRFLLTRLITGKPCTTYHILQDKPTFPVRDYQLLLTSQHDIGWNRFLQGYPSLQWYSHQLRYIQEMNIVMNPDLWLPKFYIQWYTILYDKWKYRNDLLHGKNSTFQREQLLQRIQGYYKWQHVLPIQDQHCFVRPLGEWGTQSLQVMNRWLEIHGSYIRNSVQQTRERQKLQVRDIRHWCTPITKSTPPSIPPKNPHILTPTRLLIKSPMKTIQDYFSRKPTRVTQPSAKKPSPKKPRIRASKAQKYIQTMLKITKRSKKFDDIPPTPAPNPSVSVQNIATTSTSPQEKPHGIEPTNESAHKGSTIANLVKKFERWKTKQSSIETQQKTDKNTTLEHSLCNIKTATR